MPGPTAGTSTTINKTELPQWVNDAGKANYDKAVALDAQPLVQFGGPRVADPSTATKNAFSYFDDHLTDGQGNTDAAGEVFRRLSDPNSFRAGVESYLSPYITNVEDKALGRLNDTRIQALQGNQDKAIAAKAFGGTRGAIVDAVTNSESAKDAGLLSAQLRQQGYTDAANRWSSDQATSGQGLLATGDQQLAQMLKRFGGMRDIGNQIDTHNQDVINSNIDVFDEARNKETNDLNLRLAALGMTPYNTSSTSKTKSTAPTTGFDWGALGLGGLSILAGLL